MQSHLESGTESYQLGATALLLAAVSILAALAFEHFGGLIPCPLCLQQRYAYYLGMPAIFVALVLIGADHQRSTSALFLLVSLMFLANAALGTYHAGAEWGFWPGPETCGGLQDLTYSADDFRSKLSETRSVRCDEAAIRILGLSLAGWNVVTSVVIFALTLRSAFAAQDSTLKKSL